MVFCIREGHFLVSCCKASCRTDIPRIAMIVYWAHSYRQEDAEINRHFGILIEQAGRMIVNFDPPSDKVNSAKLEQNLRSCDGMVAVLPWRASGPSPYILYEIGLALRSRKPVLVFVDDRLKGNVVPPRILQRRYSHRTYFREVRDHTHALRELVMFMGDPPPPRYQPSSRQRGCGLVGFRSAVKDFRSDLTTLVEDRGYRAVDLDGMDEDPLIFGAFEEIADLSVYIRCIDSRAYPTQYWAGALTSAGVPSIPLSCDSAYSFREGLPMDFQPRVVGSDRGLLTTVINDEFLVFEQHFLKVHDPSAIERYTQMQIHAGDLRGRYQVDTRSQYVEVVMGDKYNISGQAGAVGPHSHAHDMNFSQTWNELRDSVDLPTLASELHLLHEAMQRDAHQPSHQIAVGAVAAAAQSAREGDGPKVVEYLKTGGKWALSVAEKIGVAVASAVIKSSLGL